MSKAPFPPLLWQPWSDDRAEVSRWLKDSFLQSFVREVNPEYWPESKDTGAFAVTLLSLTYCSAATGLVCGTNYPSSDQCVDFIKKYLKNESSLPGQDYKTHAGALYKLFRHGLAHQGL